MNKKNGNNQTQNAMESEVKSFHAFQIEPLTGDDSINFNEYKGKYVLIVNVASKCGYTSQYEGLQKLQEQYEGKLVIVGFPCNQFMGQEPGSNQEIEKFCKSTYGIRFPMTKKIEVKGNDQHPIYEWLTTKALNGVGDFKISWNFNKFLIDGNGKLLKHFDSSTKPLSNEITDLLN